jgi:uncharacterized protein (DUF1778 family)
MTHETPRDPSKTERFHVRATSRQAALIRAGATRRGVKLTDYIIKSLCVQAEIDIADETNFVLPKERWNAFAKALDAPPRIPVGLNRLFSHPSVAEPR